MSDRMNKVNNMLKKVISEIILLEVQNSFDGQMFFYTVTGVKCTPDLRDANVFVSVLGDESQANKGFKYLCRQLKDIQRLMASRIHLKYTPKLFLKFDETALNAEKIESLLHKVKDSDEQDSK